jgi:hypothetical protein
MERKKLVTATAVIEELGGTNVTASLAGVKAQAVTNWRTNNRLPARTYLVFSRRLQAKRLTAPASLWGLKEPAEAER